MRVVKIGFSAVYEMDANKWNSTAYIYFLPRSNILKPDGLLSTESCKSNLFVAQLVPRKHEG